MTTLTRATTIGEQQQQHQKEEKQEQ